MACTTPRVNQNEKYELWVVMTCQCRFTSLIKCTALEEDVDNEGSDAWRGQEVCQKFLYLLNFTGNLEML